MKHVRIDAKALGAEGFRLELGAKSGQMDVIELAPGAGVSGTYEQSDGLIWLREIEATRFDVKSLGWALPSGRLELLAPGVLEGAAIDGAVATAPTGDVPRFRGTVRAGSARADAALSLAGVRAQLRGLSLEKAQWTAEGTGEQSLKASRVAIDELELDVDGYALTVRGLVLLDVSFDDRYLEVGGLALDELELASREVPAGQPRPEPAPKPRLIPDLPFLDYLTGSVHADVRTDMTVPILGRRRATHRFRVQVEDGVIDFRALERSLAFLEDLVVHIKHRDDKLVLEKNVKLIPFDRETLVWWDLDAEAQALASDKQVKLRTLLTPKVPQKQLDKAKEEMESGDKPVALRKLDVDDIDVQLQLGGPGDVVLGGGTMTLGTAEEPALKSLRVEGGLHHDATGENDDDGRLSIALNGLVAALDTVALGGWSTSAERVALEERASVELEMSGFQVTRYRVTARKVGLVGVRARGIPAAATADDAASEDSDPPRGTAATSDYSAMATAES